MFLVEQTQVPAEILPLEAFRDHLRLGRGFSDDAAQDPVLEPCLRSALAAVEAHCDKAVLARGFSWTVSAWRDLGRQSLPLAPVSAITRVAIVDRFGTEELTVPSRYVLERDVHRPALVATGFVLPQIPVGGRAEIEFTAGFGGVWEDVPADIAQAVLMLAADIYEDRSGEAAAGRGGLPPRVAALLAPRRNLRLFGRVLS